MALKVTLVGADELLAEQGLEGAAQTETPVPLTADPAWEEALSLPLPAGSARPATIRLALLDANGEELGYAEARLRPCFVARGPPNPAPLLARPPLAPFLGPPALRACRRAAAPLPAALCPLSSSSPGLAPTRFR